MAGAKPSIEPMELAQLHQLTAEALAARGEQLLRMSRDLLAQAGHLAAMSDLPEERSTGRLGLVTEQLAIEKAKVLTDLHEDGEWTRAEFADVLGLKPAGVSRWLAKLLDREHPVIERTPVGKYRYLPPPKAKRERERQAAPELSLVDPDATPKRGEPVRVPAVQRHKQDLSKSGRGSRIKRMDREYERQQAARAEREANRTQRNGHS